MFVKNLTIKNFRCFKEIKLENLPKIVAIIGENDSGKSTLLETLRYLFIESKDITTTSDHPVGDVQRNEYLWYRGDTNNSIQIEITLGLAEVEKGSRFDLPKEFSESGELFLSFVLEAKNGKMYKRWDKIEETSLPNHSKLQDLIFKINHQCKFENKFKLIPVHRERGVSEESGIGDRQSLLPYPVESGIRELAGKRVDPRESNRWWRFFDRAAPVVGPFEIVSSGIMGVKKIKEEKIDIPLQLTGGGHQMFIQLVYEINEAIQSGKEIIAIEEPENHLHPRLIKELMKIIKSRAESGPQFFITTHSPFVINNLPISNVYFAFQENGESKIKKVFDKKEGGEILAQIGVKPSDILFPDIILLVEGVSEEKIFSSILNKMCNKEYLEKAIKIIPCRGATKETPNYQFWAEISENIQLPKFAILDKNAGIEKEKLKEKGIREENIHILKKGDIEDYYPRHLIIEFLQENLEEKITVNEKDILVGKTVENLRKYFKGKKDWWKVPLAEYVSEKITFDEIEGEIKKFLNKIYKKDNENEWEIEKEFKEYFTRGNWKRGR